MLKSPPVHFWVPTSLVLQVCEDKLKAFKATMRVKVSALTRIVALKAFKADAFGHSIGLFEYFKVHMMYRTDICIEK